MSDSESDGSNVDSDGSWYPSPSQRVPGSDSDTLHRLSFSDDISMHSDGNTTYLRLLLQPQKQFRFRYKSERESGTHGCLQGITIKGDRAYPTIEVSSNYDHHFALIWKSILQQLKNYSGRAVIKCKLYQKDKNEEHPHRLHEEDRGDQEPKVHVSPDTGYVVCFQGLGIIHTAKRDVPGLLYRKVENSMTKEEFKKLNKKELREQCKKTSKSIDLNIVRLRFSAHDVINDKELCEPVFSEPIYNMKSAETNELKICDCSLYSGRAQGGDKIILLIEKVKKGNIKVNFFEKSPLGDTRCWETSVHIMDVNVHHQYALTFRTPAYRDVTISEDVDVWMELQRLSDGRCSEPRAFRYRADVIHRHKRRKLNSGYSSTCSPASTRSMASIGEISVRNISTPVIPVENNNVYAQNFGTQVSPLYEHSTSYEKESPHTSGLQTSQSVQSSQGADPLALMRELYDLRGTQQDSEGEIISEYFVVPTTNEDIMQGFEQADLLSNPMLGAPNVPAAAPTGSDAPAQPCVMSTDLPDSAGVLEFLSHNWQDYTELHGLVPDFPFQLSTDSGKTFHAEIKTEEVETAVKKEKFSGVDDEVHALDQELKELVKEICELKRETKTQLKKKLKRLFEIRQTNGDTFLHIALTRHLPSFKYIVETVHWAGMAHLLDEANDDHLTVLHLALIHDMPDVVAYLIEKGCDPMCVDSEGNSALHYAVTCRGLPALLAALDTKGGCNFSPHNDEGQTPLHVCALQRRPGARPLLQRGAAPLAADAAARLPLHAAVIHDQPDLVATLIEYMQKRDINRPEGATLMTPLQIACAQNVRENTLNIIQLLLENGADPYTSEGNTEPAWKLAYKRPPLWEVMRRYVTLPAQHSDSASSDDDDFESADEGDSENGDVTTKLKSMVLRDN